MEMAHAHIEYKSVSIPHETGLERHSNIRVCITKENIRDESWLFFWTAEPFPASIPKQHIPIARNVVQYLITNPRRCKRLKDLYGGEGGPARFTIFSSEKGKNAPPDLLTAGNE